MMKAVIKSVAPNGWITLAVDRDEAAMLAGVVGLEAMVVIDPVYRFEIGDKVSYSSIIGQPPVLDSVIKDGPFIVGGTLCWRIEGKAGVVADDALAKSA